MFCPKTGTPCRYSCAVSASGDTGDGQREALDVQAVISVISLYQLPPAEQLERLDQVQLIELGAINFMNKPRN